MRLISRVVKVRNCNSDLWKKVLDFRSDLFADIIMRESVTGCLQSVADLKVPDEIPREHVTLFSKLGEGPKLNNVYHVCKPRP